MKNTYFKKTLSMFLSMLILLSCCAFVLPANAAETHECVWVSDYILRPSKQADGTWGNGLITYVCESDKTHVKNEITYRANYTAYETLVGELNALLAEPALSAVAREEIEGVLAEYGISDNLIESEQAAVDAAVKSIADAVGKYIEEFTVTFVDADGTVIDEQRVTYGFDAVAPKATFKAGYVFTGWNKDFTNITADLTVTAQYVEGRAYIKTDAQQFGLQPGNSQQINAVVISDEDIDETLTWTVADTAIATVDANGVVKAVKVGYTTLTVSALNCEVKETVDIYVYDGNEEYTVQLINGGMGNFVINGHTLSNAYVKVKSGQKFSFQFALSSKYDPESIVITANGRKLSVDENNQFFVPYVCEDLIITVSLIGSDAVTPDRTEEDIPATEGDSCWCHSSNGLFSFFWDLLMFFCKMLGVESYHYCECGAAHW